MAALRKIGTPRRRAWINRCRILFLDLTRGDCDGQEKKKNGKKEPRKTDHLRIIYRNGVLWHSGGAFTPDKKTLGEQYGSSDP